MAKAQRNRHYSITWWREASGGITLVRGVRHRTQRIQDQDAAIGIMTKKIGSRFVVCIANDGYLASLEPRKLYLAVPDSEAEQLDLLKVVDESGEPYLFPEALFREIDVPRDLEKAILAA